MCYHGLVGRGHCTPQLVLGPGTGGARPRGYPGTPWSFGWTSLFASPSAEVGAALPGAPVACEDGPCHPLPAAPRSHRRWQRHGGERGSGGAVCQRRSMHRHSTWYTQGEEGEFVRGARAPLTLHAATPRGGVARRVRGRAPAGRLGRPSMQTHLMLTMTPMRTGTARTTVMKSITTTTGRN